MAHQIAIESDRVTADVVEVSEFADMAQRYSVTAVPKIVLNDQMELIGAQPESTLVKAVLELGD